MALLLEGIVRRGRALDGDLIGFQLKGLLCLRGENKRAVDDKGSAYVLLCNLFVIIQGAPLKYDLQRLEAAAVIKLDKTRSSSCRGRS